MAFREKKIELRIKHCYNNYSCLYMNVTCAESNPQSIVNFFYA